MSQTSEEELSIAAKRRIERNRQKAIIIRRSKLVSHPYAKGEVISEDTTTLKIGAKKYKDTGGGFLLEEESDFADIPDKVLEQLEPPIFDPDRPTCEKCNKVFATSWLFDKFTIKCCDTCRDPEVHKLITKTEAKETYLLKDCDFDKREPPLKFIQQKNPHNAHWGDMKLYLETQCKYRCLQTYRLRKEHLKCGAVKKKLKMSGYVEKKKKVIAKSKKYEKQMKELRKGMRSSLYDRTRSVTHTHEFGPETYNEKEDTYHRKCTTCSYEETFEKM
ncbi:hypothetical protein NQ317_010985 [Molorchus minor]|uniref:XPA C-terminal domain-containing protein n=1 Tax=Molorchus minor TaxID=1323400 RepID=A0ABQ9K2E7_9CUCU|nr:hypothetical protein NQ317_010985 [Molorchus minor]